MGKQKPQPTSPKPPPSCKAILLCERAIVEAETGSISVIGILNELGVADFPARLPAFTMYLQLVDGIGSYQIHLETLDLSSGEVIVSSPNTEIRFPERPGSIDLIIPISSLPVEHPGGYDIIVLANEQELDRQQLTIVNLAEGDSNDETNSKDGSH